MIKYSLLISLLLQVSSRPALAESIKSTYVVDVFSEEGSRCEYRVTQDNNVISLFVNDMKENEPNLELISISTSSNGFPLHEFSVIYQVKDKQKAVTECPYRVRVILNQKPNL